MGWLLLAALPLGACDAGSPGGDEAASGSDVGLSEGGAGPSGGDEAAPPADAEAAPEPVRDDDGRRVALDEPAERVVSLVPSATDLLVAMDGKERLVARTRHDQDPRLADIPSVGTGLEPNLEAVAALDPDLVVAQKDARARAAVEPLEVLGIPVYVAEAGELEDLQRHSRQMGGLVGLEERADSLAHAIQGELEEVAARVEGADPVDVLYILHPDPPFTTGSGTYLHEVIEAAGGANVFGDVEREWPEVSMEAVVRRDPDVVVASRGHEEGGAEEDWLRERSGWRSVPAVEAGRVLTVDPDLFNRPGPRVGEAARVLARFLHPDRFDEADRP